MRTSSRGLLALLLALALLAGCRKPADGFALVSRLAAEADGGRFSFDIDLEDETCTYLTAVAARIATARLDRPELELQMTVTSPAGTTAIERVTFPVAAGDPVRVRRHDGSNLDFLWPWREDIRVSGAEIGRWHVVITVPDATQLRAVEGIGLSYQRKTWEKAH